MQRLRVCVEPGCPELTHGTRCPEHAAAWGRAQDRRHGYHDRPWRWVYRDPRWRRLRRRVLTERPRCATRDCVQPATEVDHVIPLRDGGEPFDRDNLQGFCKPHHSGKTAREVRPA